MQHYRPLAGANGLAWVPLSQKTLLKLSRRIMPTTLERIPRAAVCTKLADQLRDSMAAVRLAFMWMGVRRTLTHEQRSQAADRFGAQEDYLSAAKKLLDTSHPAFRAVTSVRSQVAQYWRLQSVPYPEPGIRLIRRDMIHAFSLRLASFQVELAEAVGILGQSYAELQAAARRRLGQLFNPADYPDSLSGMFAVSYDFPNIEPPDYLRQLSPKLYEQEAARVAARFDEAVQLAEQAFMEELSRLVSHLTERLTKTTDGKPKVFRDSAVDNLHEFFDRFRQLNLHSHEQLDELVRQVERVTAGASPQALRDDQPLRQQIASQLSVVQSALDGLLIDRPRRRIMRRPLTEV
jgi:hypothetical protein